MDLTQENYRAIIFYNSKRKLSPKDCVAELVSVFVDEAPSRAAVSRWYSKFQRGLTSFDKQYDGCTSETVVMPANIDAVRQLTKEDRYVTYREIQASLGISGTSVKNILHQELGARKLISRWIPLCSLPIKKQLSPACHLVSQKSATI